jgi:hypothetical protein
VDAALDATRTQLAGLRDAPDPAVLRRLTLETLAALGDGEESAAWPTA